MQIYYFLIYPQGRHLSNNIHDSHKILFEKTNDNELGKKRFLVKNLNKLIVNLKTRREPQKLVVRVALGAALS